MSLPQRIFGRREVNGPRAGDVALGIDFDTAFGLFQSERRRLVVRELAESSDGVYQLGRLAKIIAGRQMGVQPRAVDESEKKTVYVGLYQSHLDKMHEAGLVYFEKAGEYREQATVYATAQTAPAARFLDVNARMLADGTERGGGNA